MYHWTASITNDEVIYMTNDYDDVPKKAAETLDKRQWSDMRCCFCEKDLSKELSTGEIRGGLGNKVLANLCSDCYRKYMLLQQNCSIFRNMSSVELIEKHLGVKLFWYQKMILHIFDTKMKLEKR